MQEAAKSSSPDDSKSRTVLIAAYAAVALLPLALYLPFLGFQGLWDPWETHYSEVARRIVTDGDWITLRWHDELFFSKPVFLFWTIALSFKLFGVSEWAARLPILLFSITGLVILFHYVRRFFGLWQGIAASLIMATTPFWAMISRQAMTDMQFVVAMSAGILALLYYLIRPEASRLHAYAAYAFFGISVLAKGLMGLVVPGAIFFIMILLSRRWDLLGRARLLAGTGIFSAVALPWYLAVSLLHGKTFLYEFFFLHHIARAGGGVHGERGTFEYFLSHLGWGMLPWTVLAVPALVHFAARIREASRRRDSAALLSHLGFIAWAAGTLGLFTIARTKFHHYIFPAVLPLSVIIGVWAVEKIRRGAEAWEKALVLMAFLPALLLVRDIMLSTDHLTFLFTYAYERPAGAPPESGPVSAVVLACFLLACVVCLLRSGSRLRRIGAGAALLTALCFTAFLVHRHMPASSLHLSQKESFDQWEAKGMGETDRFYNWKMNWRGEIYYSKDTIKKVSRLEQLRPILAKPGRTFIISTIERYKQLDMEIERIRGKKLEKFNPHDLRYGFGMYDGPVLKAVPEPPLTTSLPSDATPLAAAMGDGLLELAGYRVDGDTVKIGDSFMVTLFWKPLKKIEERWIVFIHGEKYWMGEAKRFNGNHVTGEGLFATERWVPGTLIEDAFAVCVDYGIPAGTYTLKAGLYRDKERLGVDEQWMHDGHNRIPIGSIEVTR